MHRKITCIVILLLIQLPATHAQRAHVAPTKPLSPEQQRNTMHLPPGFEIQLVASEPDIINPMNIAFDAKGRLWVTQSVEYPYPAPEGRTPKDTVKILERFAANSEARKITTFADGLNIPIGVLPDPSANGAIVFSIPYIFRLADVNGDDKADKKVLLYDKYGYRDTHGMTGEFMRGFDGWIYACHGFSNTSKVRDNSGNAIVMQSGNTYRFKPDGSRVEYFTHGQVNPFGLAFDPLGNLYSCDCHSKPIYQLLKGAYYPSFGKPHDGLGFGPTMIGHSHGSTAIAGIAYYAAEHFPKAFHDNIFIGNVVTNRINRDRLEWHGSSPKAIEMPDLVRSDDPWFRPVDIKLGPDGALYVADFYNKIIGHYEVPLDHPGRDRSHGRIWRIVYRGKDGKTKLPALPNLTEAKVEKLVESLGHSNLTNRMFAADQLVRRDASVSRLKTLIEKGSAMQRAHGLWILHRLGALSEVVLQAGAADRDATVRVHAMRVLAERKSWTPDIRKLALDGLHDKSPHVQRAAAGALASHPQVENIAPLIVLRENVPAKDTHLLHVVRMALRNQLRDEKWVDENWTPKQQKWIADVCPGMPDAKAADFLLEYLQKSKLPPGTAARYLHHGTRYCSDQNEIPIHSLQKSPIIDQVVLFRAYHRGLRERGDAISDSGQRWVRGLCAKLLKSKDTRAVQMALELAGEAQLSDFMEPIQTFARKSETALAVRMAAVKTLAQLNWTKNLELLSKILRDVREPQQLRQKIVESLSGIDDEKVRIVLLQTMETAPLAFQRIVAIGLTANRGGAEAVLQAVKNGKASARLLRDRAVAVRLERSQIPKVKEKIRDLTKGIPPADAELQNLLSARHTSFLKKRGQVALGHKVFQKNCAACHQIGNEGKKIGPQLDGIGNRGLERILEDLIDPNRNVDQAFRTTIIETKNGQLQTGLFLRQAGKLLVLADDKGEEVQIPAADVARRTTSPISPMPSNFVEQLSAEDFNHLLAFLLAQQNAKK